MPAQIIIQLACKQKNIPSKIKMLRWVNTVAAKNKKISITVRLVKESEMRQLNKLYRKKDKITDILSFSSELPKKMSGDFIGDIALCLKRINADINKKNKVSDHHWAHLLIHGTLHLLGFDHETIQDADIMMAREIKCLNQLGIPNPYEINHE